MESTVDSTLRNKAAPARTRTASLAGSVLLSFYMCSCILVVFLFTTTATSHWFIFPVLACGVLIGIDGIRALRGHLDLFQPVGFVGVVGLHVFFLAPLIHVRWDYWVQYIRTSSVDWRHWLGMMAWINLLGLCAYFLVSRLVLRTNTSKGSQKHWQLNEERFWVITVASVVMTGLLQILVYRQFGGISGYVNSVEVDPNAMQGYGIVFMISESFPIIAMMMFVVWAKKHTTRQHWLVLLSAVAIFIAVRFLFGGLRGSRGNIIWGLFWAVGMIHVWLRPVPRKLLYVGAVSIVLFMYVYSFYKTLGTEAFTVYQEQGNIAALEQQSGRSLEGVVLGDLARSDVQAFLLYRLSPKAEGIDYEYAKGGTYLGAVALIVPRWIWNERPPTKVEAGTDALYGEGASQVFSSSRAYGIAGEAMLNFGVLAVPIAYGVFGAVVALAQRWREGLQPEDSRLLIAPFATVFSFYFLIWDSDNLFVLFLKIGLVPILLVFASSRRTVVPEGG